MDVNAMSQTLVNGLLKQSLANIPNVLTESAPVVEVLEFSLAGPALAVRPHCSKLQYWQVYFDTKRATREVFGDARFHIPDQYVVLRNGSGVAAAYTAGMG